MPTRFAWSKIRPTGPPVSIEDCSRVNAIPTPVAPLCGIRGKALFHSFIHHLAVTRNAGYEAVPARESPRNLLGRTHNDIHRKGSRHVNINVNGSVPHNRIFSFSSRVAQQHRQGSRRAPFNRFATRFELHGHPLPHRRANASLSLVRRARPPCPPTNAGMGTFSRRRAKRAEKNCFSLPLCVLRVSARDFPSMI